MTAEDIEKLKKELAKIFVTKEEFETPRKIFVSGDASGSADVVGNKNATILVKVTNSLMAKTALTALEISTVKKALNAINATVADVASRCSGNSKTATQLKDGRSLFFTGDVDAETIFDGSKDLIIDVKVKNSESAITDEDGNNIVDTYARKSELPQFSLQVADYNGSPCLFLGYEGKFYRFVGEEV